MLPLENWHTEVSYYHGYSSLIFNESIVHVPKYVCYTPNR